MSSATDQNHNQDSSVPSETANAEQKPAITSSLRKNIRIDGDISSREDMFIDGKVEGTIALKMNKLEIGLNGYIEANIFAKTIMVSGEVRGDLYASDQVIVTKTGRVLGNIFAGDVSIEDGAYLKGTIDMQKQDVFKQYVASDMMDEQHGKSMFGFIFKKDREISHDTMLLPDLRENVGAEQPASFSIEDNFAKTAQLANRSIFGETVVIKGQVTTDESEDGEGSDGSEGDIIILGHVDGVIYFKNCCLGIGAHSEIHGNVFVKTLVHYGRIDGNIYSNKVNIKKPGYVEGQIFSPRVSTEKGATLMGSICMEQQDIAAVYNKQYGPAVLIEGSTEQNNEEVIEQVEVVQLAPVQSDIPNRNPAWPIFYPRA